MGQSWGRQRKGFGERWRLEAEVWEAVEEFGDDPHFRDKMWVRKPGAGLGSRLGLPCWRLFGN